MHLCHIPTNIQYDTVVFLRRNYFPQVAFFASFSKLNATPELFLICFVPRQYSQSNVIQYNPEKVP